MKLRFFNISIALLLICWIISSCQMIPIHQERPQAQTDPKPTPPTPENVPAPPPVSSSQTESPPESEPVLAIVGDRIITRKEFETNYRHHLLLAEREDFNPLSRREFLEKMILEERIEQYAGKEGIESDPAFMASLNREKQRLLIDHIMQKHLRRKVNATEEEMRWHYSEKLEDYTQPLKIHIRHIMTGTRDEAEEALRRLEGGESFDAVARDMSIHASRDQGGRLPPFSKGTYNRDFEEAAFSIKVGERSSIIKTDLGYHIIEKTGETSQTTLPFEDVRDEIRERIVREKTERAMKNFYQKLETDIDLKILEQP